MKADAKISDLKGGEEIFTIPVGGICLQLQPFGIVNPAGHTHLTEGILSEAMDDVAHRDAQAIINMEASFAKPKHWRIRRENSFRGPEARRRARAFPEANAAVTLMDGIIDKLRKTPGYKALYSMHGRQEFDFGDEPLKLIISQNFTALGICQSL